MNKKIIITFTTILIVILSVQAIRIFQDIRKLNVSTNIKNKNAKAKGSIDSKFIVHEYSDYQCPGCAYAAKILKQYYSRYPDKMYVEHRYYPLASHKHSIIASVYAECASRQNKFWEFNDALFDQQQIWSQKDNPEYHFIKMAKEINIDTTALQACIKDKEVEKSVLADKEVGTALKVQSTPTFFINGEIFVGGQSILERLEKSFGKLDY